MSSQGPETVYRFGGDAGELLAEIARMRGGMATVKTAAKEAGDAIAAANERAARSTKGAADGAKTLDGAQRTLAGSTKLTANETAQLGYQLQDFFVQVQAGQSPLTALVQQGSQLAGSFGGVRGAISAVTSLLTPMVLGVGAAALAVGGLGLAAYQGSQQQETLNRALLLTNNAAGQTAGGVEALVRRIAEGSGQSIADVRAMSDAFLGLGTLGPQAYGAVTAAAATYQRASGATAEESVQLFAKMADGATKWAVETNKQYNFLTLAVYDQIKALEDQGRTQEAVTVAANAFDSSIRGRIANLGAWEVAWNGVKRAVGGLIQELKDLGKQQTAEQALAAAQGRVDDIKARQRLQAGGFVPFGGRRRATDAAALREAEAEVGRRAIDAEGQATAAAYKAASAEGVKAAIAGQQRIETVTRETDKRARLTEELNKNAKAFADVNAQRQKEGLAPLPQSQLDKLQAAEREKYKEKAGPKAAKVATPEDGLLQSIRERRTLLDAEAASEVKLTEQQKFALDVRAKLADTTRKYSAAAREKITAELADYERSAGALRQRQLANIAEDEGNRLTAQREQQLLGIGNALDAFAAAQARNVAGIAAEASLIGKTAEQREQAAQLRRLDEAAQVEQHRITLAQQEAVKTGNFGAIIALGEQRREVEAQAAAVRDVLIPAIEARYRLEASGAAGIANAQAKYTDQLRNQGALIEGSLTKAFSAAEDAFVHMATTGRISVDGLLRGLAEDALRLTYRQQYAQPVSQGITSAVQTGLRYLSPGKGQDAEAAAFARAQQAIETGANQLTDATRTAGMATDRLGFGLDRAADLLSPFGSAVMSAIRALSNVGGGGGSGIWGQLASAVGSYFGGGSSYGGSVSGGTGVAGAVGNNPSAYLAPSANGNAFTGSGIVQRFAAGGAFGLPTLGAAGPQAILPLRRDDGGRLAVHAVDGSGRPHPAGPLPLAAAAFAAGAVVDRPTRFRFGAQGEHDGLMGEAGAEWVGPVKRIAGGGLGVPAPFARGGVLPLQRGVDGRLALRIADAAPDGGESARRSPPRVPRAFARGGLFGGMPAARIAVGRRPADAARLPVHAFARGGVVERLSPARFAAGGSFAAGLMSGATVEPMRRAGVSGSRPGVEVASDGARSAGGARDRAEKPLVVNVINNGEPVKATATQRETDTERIIDVVLDRVADSIQSGGKVHDAMSRQYGVSRAVGLPRMG